MLGLIAIWVGMPGVFLLLSGVLVAGWQVYAWVKFGTWLEKPLLGVAFGLVHPDTSWLAHPRSFLVLQSVIVAALRLTPLSGFLIVTGAMLIFAGYRISGVRNTDAPGEASNGDRTSPE